MQILNVILTILFAAAFLAFWIAPVILGVKWARRKGISPHWMWFGIYPVIGWIAFAIIRWGVQTRTPGEVAARRSGVKVVCPSCGRVNSTGDTSCTKCGAAIPKPVCPACGATETQFVNRSGGYVAGGVVALLFAGAAANAMQTLGLEGAAGGTLLILVALAFTIAATVLFVKAFSRKAKLVKCLSCGAENPATEVTEFR